MAGAVTLGTAAFAVNAILNTLIRRERGKEGRQGFGFECRSALEVDLQAQATRIKQASTSLITLITRSS